MNIIKMNNRIKKAAAGLTAAVLMACAVFGTGVTAYAGTVENARLAAAKGYNAQQANQEALAAGTAAAQLILTDAAAKGISAEAAMPAASQAANAEVNKYLTAYVQACAEIQAAAAAQAQAAAAAQAQAAAAAQAQAAAAAQARAAAAAKAQAAAPAQPVLSTTPLSETAARRGLTRKYANLKVAIVGDSISTYGGAMPEGYIQHYPQPYLNNIEYTWWKQVLNATGMVFLQDASWSGSRVAGDPGDPSGKTGCSIKRAKDIVKQTPLGPAVPDVVFIMMGANDLFSNIPVGTVGDGSTATFAGAYNRMISNIQAVAPNAIIFCMTCIPVTCMSTSTKQVNDIGLTIEPYNDVIRQTAAARGLQLIETWNCGINHQNWRDFTGDGVHPNFQGAALIANCVVSTMN